jgi:hypothetical protein
LDYHNKLRDVFVLFLSYCITFTKYKTRNEPELMTAYGMATGLQFPSRAQTFLSSTATEQALGTRPVCPMGYGGLPHKIIVAGAATL